MLKIVPNSNRDAMPVVPTATARTKKHTCHHTQTCDGANCTDEDHQVNLKKTFCFSDKRTCVGNKLFTYVCIYTCSCVYTCACESGECARACVYTAITVFWAWLTSLPQYMHTHTHTHTKGTQFMHSDLYSCIDTYIQTWAALTARACVRRNLWTRYIHKFMCDKYDSPVWLTAPVSPQISTYVHACIRSTHCVLGLFVETHLHNR
jgi:hypothetical protein